MTASRPPSSGRAEEVAATATTSIRRARVGTPCNRPWPSSPRTGPAAQADPDKVALEIEARLRADLKRSATFRGFTRPRTIVTYRTISTPARALAADIPTAERKTTRRRGKRERSGTRGTTPRLYRNAWCFSPDRRVTRISTRRSAGSSPFSIWRRGRAEPRPAPGPPARPREGGRFAWARLPETYQWVLVPNSRVESAVA